jgi:hypothetical protein
VKIVCSVVGGMDDVRTSVPTCLVQVPQGSLPYAHKTPVATPSPLLLLLVLLPYSWLAWLPSFLLLSPHPAVSLHSLCLGTDMAASVPPFVSAQASLLGLSPELIRRCKVNAVIEDDTLVCARYMMCRMNSNVIFRLNR